MQDKVSRKIRRKFSENNTFPDLTRKKNSLLDTNFFYLPRIDEDEKYAEQRIFRENKTICPYPQPPF